MTRNNKKRKVSTSTQKQKLEKGRMYRASSQTVKRRNHNHHLQPRDHEDCITVLIGVNNRDKKEAPLKPLSSET